MEDDDRVRQAAQTTYQALLEAELTAVMAPPRTSARPSDWPSATATPGAGDLGRDLELRAGSFFLSLLERRRRVDQALFTVVMEAYLHGVSTRKVDDLVRRLAPTAASARARLAASAPTSTMRWRRSGTAPCRPGLADARLDATYCKARVNRRVVAQAVVVATGIVGDGHREVLGVGVGDSEDGAFWTTFLRSLKARGLAGCSFLRNVLASLPNRRITSR